MGRRVSLKIQLSNTDNLFVVTGAGISAESGLATFRDFNGLWEGHNIFEVASPEGWQQNPSLVWNFYSMRRRNALAAAPNAAHSALAEIEKSLGDRFFLCTQNVDDLHERAGSQRVWHIHGKLFSSRCTECAQSIHDVALHDEGNDLPICAACGARMRPDIVWFGENLKHADEVLSALDEATLLVVIGTSGTVSPVSNFVYTAANKGIPTYYLGLEAPLNASGFDHILLGKATETVPELFLGEDLTD